MNKNGFFTFCFACIPGAGQMYQGYMKRGLSILTILLVAVGIGSIFYLDAFLVMAVLIIWMYSFFDTFNIRNQILQGVPPVDEYMFALPQNVGEGVNKVIKNGKWLGWGCIGGGVFLLYQSFVSPLLYSLIESINNDALRQTFYRCMNNMGNLVVAVVLVYVGVRLLKGSKKEAEAETYTRFTSTDEENEA